MRALPTWAKLGIGCVVVLVVLAGLAVGALLSWAGSRPREWTAESSIVIAAPAEEIAPLVEDLRRWPEWSPWSRDVAGDLRREYSGAERGAGATLTWGNEERAASLGPFEVTMSSGGPADHPGGRGTLEILSADAAGIRTRANHGRELSLASESSSLSLSTDGHEHVIDGAFRFEPAEGGTRVTWTESGSFGDGLSAGFVAGAMRSIVARHHREVLDKGLASLRARVEGPR